MKRMFGGTTKECLEHLALRLGKHRASTVARVEEILTRFTRLSETRVVRRWLSGDAFPNSLRLLQLRFFLAACGYDVEELAKLQTTVRAFAQQVAFGLIEVENAQTVSEYKKLDDFWKGILGKSAPTSNRRLKMQSFLATQGASADPQLKEMTDVLSGLLGVIPTDQPIERTPRGETGDDTSLNKTQVLQAAAALVNSLRPIARFILFDPRFTAKDRERLHELTGDDGIFNLSNDINGLCSESARRTRLSHEEKTR